MAHSHSHEESAVCTWVTGGQGPSWSRDDIGLPLLGIHTGREVSADGPEGFQKEIHLVCVLVSHDINCVACCGSGCWILKLHRIQ